jgi:hypothetical protein
LTPRKVNNMTTVSFRSKAANLEVEFPVWLPFDDLGASDWSAGEQARAWTRSERKVTTQYSAFPGEKPTERPSASGEDKRSKSPTQRSTRGLTANKYPSERNIQPIVGQRSSESPVSVKHPSNSQRKSDKDHAVRGREIQLDNRSSHGRCKHNQATREQTSGNTAAKNALDMPGLGAKRIDHSGKSSIERKSNHQRRSTNEKQRSYNDDAFEGNRNAKFKSSTCDRSSSPRRRVGVRHHRSKSLIGDRPKSPSRRVDISCRVPRQCHLENEESIKRGPAIRRMVSHGHNISNRRLMMRRSRSDLSNDLPIVQAEENQILMMSKDSGCGPNSAARPRSMRAGGKNEAEWKHSEIQPSAPRISRSEPTKQPKLLRKSRSLPVDHIADDATCLSLSVGYFNDDIARHLSMGTSGGDRGTDRAVFKRTGSLRRTRSTGTRNTANGGFAKLQLARAVQGALPKPADGGFELEKALASKTKGCDPVKQWNGASYMGS